MRSSTLAAFLLLLLPVSLLGQPQDFELHSEHWIHGVPLGTPETNDLIIRDIYALSSNDARKFADWVGYRLTVYDVDGPSLERDWAEDPWLDPDETLEEDDYDGAHGELGTNRGHQAPLASFRGTLQGDQANYLSNITPQKAALNQGPWGALEDAVRALAREDTVWVLTGPLYEDSMPSLPRADEDHAIPSGYWKIVALQSEPAPEVAGFILGQDLGHSDDYCDYQATVREIETRTGLDVFWKLEDEAEEDLETGGGATALLGRLGC